MFGVVPRAIWQRNYTPDEKNRIQLILQSLLIIENNGQDGKKNVTVVDAGIGNYQNEKLNNIYNVQNNYRHFDELLEPFGVNCEAVSELVLTHMHFDHACGAATKTDSGFIPTFPNARVWLQKKQWDWAQNPSPKDLASFQGPPIEILKNNPKLNLIEGEKKITDNISVIPLDGHSPGMQAVLVNVDGQKHFFATDLVPMAGHVHLPYIAAFDNDPVAAVKEKQKLLERSVNEHWLVYFQHDQNCQAAYIKTENNKFVISKDSK